MYSPKSDLSSTLSPISLTVQYNRYFESPPIDLIDLSDETMPRTTLMNIYKYIVPWDIVNLMIFK